MMKNRILFNSVLLAGSNFLMKALAYLYFIIIARSFSPTEMGLYALLITIYLFMELSANLGLDRLIIRDMVQQDEDGVGATFFLSLAIKAAAATISFAGFAAMFGFIFPDIWANNRTEVLIVLSAVFPLVLCHNIESHFTALEKMYVPAVSQLVERLVILAAAGLVALNLLNFKGFLFGVLAATFTRAALLTAIYPWRYWRRRFGITTSRARELVGGALKMAIVEAMAIVYFRVDILMLSKMTDLDSTGVYQVAYKVFEFFIALFAGFLIALFPKISREGERFLLMRYLGLGAFTLVLVALPVIWARESVLSLFQLEFVKGSTVLLLLMMTLPLVYWNSMLANFALAVHRLGLLIRIAVALVSLNIGLNLILIPRFSIDGAAAATLICELISGVLLLYGLREEIHRGRMPIPAVKGREAA